MIVRCVDDGLAEGITLAQKYLALNENLEPLSDMEWFYLKPYDLIYIQLDSKVSTYPKWRFVEERFFKQYDEPTKEAINILKCPISLGEFEELERNFERPTQEDKKEEKVNHPQHYNQGKYEVIDVIEDWDLGFNLGNTVKYIGRAGHKDDKLQDLRKALWYLQREIDRLEKLWDEEMEF